MWLPENVYERLPQAWLLLGLLFMSSGTYLGFDYPLTKFYFGTGLACCLWSGWTFTMRLKNREVPEQSKQAPEQSSQSADPSEPGST